MKIIIIINTQSVFEQIQKYILLFRIYKKDNTKKMHKRAFLFPCTSAPVAAREAGRGEALHACIFVFIRIIEMLERSMLSRLFQELFGSDAAELLRGQDPCLQRHCGCLGMLHQAFMCLLHRVVCNLHLRMSNCID